MDKVGILPFITTSALQVQFGLRDLVVIGLSKTKFDFAKVERVQNQQVDITYYKRSNLKLSEWLVEGKPYTDQVHINAIVYRLESGILNKEDLITIKVP